MTYGTQTVVVADANVLINLIHVARLGFCADLPGLSFMVPDHVLREITRPELGRGEAACLVLAKRHGWTVASDEKGRFRREALKRVGSHRLIGTPDLFIRAIQAGLVTVDEADADKETLERKRFKMTFKSFREKLQEPAATRPGRPSQ